MTSTLSVGEVTALLLDERFYSNPLRPKTFYKLLYFADKELDDAYTEMEPKARAKKWSTAIEKIYLDSSYWVMSYDKYRWPMNSKFGGAVENLTDPAYANWGSEYGNLYLKDNVKK